MTLDQLAIFVAVAEREHLTRAADAIGRTPSAVSAAIRALEAAHGAHLFDRVGRSIELSPTGKALLPEARRTLAAARQTQDLLNDLGGLNAGGVSIEASQTIANYWLPSRILAFSTQHPRVSVQFDVGNTTSVARSVLVGEAELGFVEGAINEPALVAIPIHTDELVIVVPGALKDSSSESFALTQYRWIMREPGSGTRTEFEHALTGLGLDTDALDVALTLPTNEAVLTAVLNSRCAAALSRLVVAPFLLSGQLSRLNIELPVRRFTMLHHKQRRLTAAARKFMQACTD